MKLEKTVAVTFSLDDESKQMGLVIGDTHFFATNTKGHEVLCDSVPIKDSKDPIPVLTADELFLGLWFFGNEALLKADELAGAATA